MGEKHIHSQGCSCHGNENNVIGLELMTLKDKKSSFGEDEDENKELQCCTHHSHGEHGNGACSCDGHDHFHEEDCCGHDHEVEGEDCGCCGHSASEAKLASSAISGSKGYKVKEFLINGLHCASCAAKIEGKVADLSLIKGSVMNFATSTLTIEVREDNADTIIDEVQKIADQVEPGAIVEDKSKLAEKNADKEEKKKHMHRARLYRIGLGIAVLLSALYLKEEPFGVFLFIISYFAIGKDIIAKSVRNILRGELFDENFLMAIATLAAFGIGEYPEAIMVVLLYEIGEYFQGRAVESSRKSIAELMDIRPEYANLKMGDDFKRVSPTEVGIGDLIIVKPGEKVPLDGKIIEGSSSVDTAALTGESALRDVSEGDEITSGFININGVLSIEVTKSFNESAVSKILHLVENASSKKAETEKRITKFAKYYTPFVVVAAIMTALIPPIVMDGQSFGTWVYKAAIFLVISCPCALVISVPMGYFAGLGASSKNGILVKGGNYLEALTQIDTVVFDKTGTLTKGSFRVYDIKGANGISDNVLLRYTAFAESFSNHPIALSITQEYDGRIDKKLVKNYMDVAGKGVMALVDGVQVASGNKKLMDQLGIKCKDVEEVGTVIYTALDGKYAGYIVIKDEVKRDSKEAIKRLKHAGIEKVAMLTGDKKEVADIVGKEIGIDRVYSELLPQDKVEKVEELYREETKGIAFVGDGINDAPVLARANVGVAMGGVGSDAAIEAADVVIMNDEPSKLAKAIEIAKRTKGIVNMNIGMSVGIKGLVFILTFMNLGSMWLAIFADVGVSIIAVMNSMRILKS